MSRKQFALTLLVAVVAGLTGGVGGSWFFAGEPAYAQKTSKGKVIEADVVKAKGIISSTGIYLVDDTGKPRIQLAFFGGEPSLWLFDKDRKSRIQLGLLEGEPSLSLSDQSGKERAVLGSTSLEKTRTGSVENLPPSSLVLFDKEGKVIWQAPEL